MGDTPHPSLSSPSSRPPVARRSSRPASGRDPAVMARRVIWTRSAATAWRFLPQIGGFWVAPRLGANDPHLRAVDPRLRAMGPRLRSDQSPAPGPDSPAPRNEEGPRVLDSPPRSRRSPAPRRESRAPNRGAAAGMHFLERGPSTADERERAEAAVRCLERSKCLRYSPRSPGHEQGSCERDGACTCSPGSFPDSPSRPQLPVTRARQHVKRPRQPTH